MHQLQPKHFKLKPSEVNELFKQYNISAAQLPTIKSTDKALPAEVKIGDIIKIERKAEEKEKSYYYRLVVP